MASGVVIWGLAACGDPASFDPSGPILRATRGTLQLRIVLTGSLEAVEVAEIKAPAIQEGNSVIEWMVDDGTEVEAGDAVVVFDSSSFVDSLDVQRASVARHRRMLLQSEASGEAEILSAIQEVERARVEFAKAELDTTVPEALQSRYEYRQKQLAGERARAELEKSKQDLRASRVNSANDLRISEEQLRKEERELAVAEGAIEALRLTAPRAGFVTVARSPREDREIQEGDAVWAGLTLMQIPDVSRMRVAASLSDVDDGKISVGMSAMCVLDIHPELDLAGRITEIAPVAREEGGGWSTRRSFRVVIELDRTPTEIHLSPGMSVKAVIALGDTEDAVLAPRAALDVGIASARARLADGGWRTVRLGRCSSQRCVVVEGLEGGELLAAAEQVAP